MRIVFLLAAFAGVLARAQAPTAEITTKEATPTFTSGTNLVPVTVVVRDRNDKAIGNLVIDDFELFDNGKPQMISKFSVEKLVKDAPASAPAAPPASQPIAASGATPVDLSTDGAPTRFVAYLFDDLHLSPGDLKRTVDAARAQIDAAPNTQRMGIYTTSGLTMQDFTADHVKLHAALASMNTGQALATGAQRSSCPPMTYYMGYQIYEKENAQMLAMSVADAMRCANLTQPPALALARIAAREADLQGNKETASSLEQLRNVVAKMASMPGKRTLVLVSDGFLVTDDRLAEETGLIERAIRANVVIGSLDARGVYQVAMPDASEANVNPNTLAQKSTIRNAEATIQSDVMANLADGTGGTFYHGLNDYRAGMELTAAAPDYLYVLGFSPMDLKLDGKFHNLKITLKTVKGMDIQARKGYYAPQHATDPAERARQQIEESFFSRDEVHDLPATLQTQFFADDKGGVTLSTIAKIDIRRLPFRKDAGRNDDDLTVITGLFDNDGNYVTGIQKVVQMKLLDATVEKLSGSGISLKNTFQVHSGRYMVRMVVRDSEGELMSAQSGLVDIP